MIRRRSPADALRALADGMSERIKDAPASGEYITIDEMTVWVLAVRTVADLLDTKED